MTTTQSPTAFLRVEPPRDRYGRYLVDGKPHTRVTTFAKTLDDTWGLTNWKIRMALKGVGLRQDLYALAAATPIEDKQGFDKLGESCIEAAAGSAGANTGIGLHAFAEQTDLGLTPTIPKPWDDDIAAYSKTLADHDVRIVPEYVERICVIPSYGLAGTFDRLVQFGSTLKVADLKTAKSLDYSWGSIAVQLALYAHAETIWDPATKTSTPMPEVDQDSALVIHLPVGKATCTLYWVDIKAGWAAVEHAGWVRDWRKRKDLAEEWTDNEPVTVPDVRRARLIQRLESLIALGAKQQVADNWPPTLPTFKHSDSHTPDQLNQIDSIFVKIEALVGAPFGPLDPNSSVATKEKHSATPEH